MLTRELIKIPPIKLRNAVRLISYKCSLLRTFSTNFCKLAQITKKNDNFGHVEFRFDIKLN